jgi:hypothetical protein
MTVSELQALAVLLLIANVVIWPICAYWLGRLHERKRGNR